MLCLVLASQSPRRRELLMEAGFEFTVDPVKVSEIIDENLTPEGAVLAVAAKKISTALELPKYSKSKGFLLLSADTVVVLGKNVLGKPSGSRQATKFLTDLSGKTHSVMTAVCLAESAGGKSDRFVETTRVTFRDLQPAEIEEYVRTGEPLDKAGAYGIQGLAGGFVSRVEGSWSNVVGLPLERLDEVLKKNGWDVGLRKSP